MKTIERSGDVDKRLMTSSSISVNVGDCAFDLSKCHRYYLIPTPTSTPEDNRSALDDVITASKPYDATPSASECDDDTDSNFMHLVHFSTDQQDTSTGKPFREVMTEVGFSETIAVGGIDPKVPRRSCASLCHYENYQREKVELVFGKQAKYLPVDYHESMICYGHNSTRRRYRSTVVYRPKMVPESYSDTCYIRPKRPETTFVSYLDVGTDEHFRRKWFSSAVHVEPMTVSNVVVGGFRWLQGSEQNDWDDGATSSGICSDDDDDEWSRADRYRTVNFNSGSRSASTTLVVNRH